MLKRNFVRWVVLPVALIASTALIRPCAFAADPDPIAARMDTFAGPNGVSHFALSLKPAATVEKAPRDVIVLFSTSASQTGEFRAKALDALKGVLAGLAPGDRVQLMAVDLDAVPLTSAFVAPAGDEMTEALAALEARVPLGASDMAKAVEAVVRAESKNPKAVVYLGDGRSTANLLDIDAFRQLSGKLASAKIPMNSYLIGPRVDRQLAGALAVQSGGTVLLDDDAVEGVEAGRRLAAAADATVLWPTSRDWPAEIAEIYPKQIPPLRGDRETVLVGVLKDKKPVKIEISVESLSGPKTLRCDVSPAASDDRNAYLARLVEQAKIDGGLSLPLVGSASLAEAKREIDAGVRNLSRLAQEALSAGNLVSAERLIDQALRGDPNDADALALKDVLQKRKLGEAPAAGPQEGVSSTPAEAGAAADLNLVGPQALEPPPGALAEGFQHDRRIIRQVINAEVQNTLGKARSLMSTNPDVAAQELKMVLEKVRGTAELNPDARDQFVDAIQSALREAARKKVEVERNRQKQLENAAAAQERLLVAENLLRREEKVNQLMQRCNSLMNEGRYREAEESAALEAKKLVPDSPVPRLAELEARQVGYYENFMKLRDDRWRGVVDVLYQTEKSHVPFPDEPPIVYPDAEVWRQLTIRRREKWSSVDLANPNQAEKAIREAMKSPTLLDFIETPLSEVVDYLKKYHKIEIQLDKKALDDLGVSSDTPITISLQGVSLRSALRLLLKQHQLTYVIQDEVLLITSPEEAENRLVTKVYPVADLVIPVQSMSMGGMGMGMGMFNLPDILKKMPPGGFQAFSVKDDLTRQPQKTNDAVKADAPAAVPSNAPATIGGGSDRIDVVLKKGDDPVAVWSGYFSKNQPQPAAVREKVRQLTQEKQFDQLIALIGAAIRNRQAQPWMYEAMALALEASGRPKAEIERAVMSAVDFVDNVADLMYVGAYLSKIGLNRRALQVYRQAASLDPMRPEPYMLGLRAARADNDLDGLKWASLGILGQAWPKEHTDVWNAGVGVAKEVLEKLRAENRTEEADRFQEAVNEAVVRDCVVIVTWTGDSDIDLLVEEPTGTVCSSRSPRTTGGGVLLGDVSSQAGREDRGERGEVYVCPKGFDGAYRVLLRRVWGNVTAGKVNVKVINHYLGPNAVEVRKQIPLDKDEALVVFDLNGGRRTEPLHEQQVANAAIGQMALNRQILAQNLASSLDTGAIQSLAASRAISSGNNHAGWPYAISSAVGYQPVITVLPEGAMLSAQAVISADRRYVRITPMPFFSGIGEVNTFNMATGATGQSSAGAGASGFGGMGGMGGMGGGY